MKFRQNEFTWIGNSVVMDRKLSLKAKGLYLLIQCYTTGPSLSTLINECREGEKAFMNALEELISYGYLIQHK